MPELTEENGGTILLTTFATDMKAQGEPLVLKDIYVDATIKEAALPTACPTAKEGLPYRLTLDSPPVMRGTNGSQAAIYPPFSAEVAEAELSLEVVHPNPRSMILEFSSPRKDLVPAGRHFMQVRSSPFLKPLFSAE